MSKILFKNGAIVDVASKQARTGYEVLVEGNIIAKVSDKPIHCPDATVFDLAGKTLMPGLIDAHVHVTATENEQANEHIPERELGIQAAKFLENMLQRGYTSVRDAGGADLGLANAINKGLVAGPRLFYSGKALSQTGGHGDFRKPAVGDPCSCSRSGSCLSRIADGVAEVRKAVRDELRKGATQIKVMASGGIISPTDRITNLQYSDEELMAIVDEAGNHGTYVMAHAYTPEAIIRCVKAGVRTIEHGNRLNEAAAEAMAKAGVYLVPTLVTYEALRTMSDKYGLNEEGIEKLKQVHAVGLQAIKIARAKGVKIGLGSDLLGAEGHTWQNKEFEVRSAVETPYESIVSATAINGEILQSEGKLGVIAVGAYADLLVVDGNPLQDISLLSQGGDKLSLIMKNGVIYKNQLA